MPRTVTLANGSMLVAFDAQGALRDLTWPQVGSENHAQGRATQLALVRSGRGCVLGGPGSTIAQESLPAALAAKSSFGLPHLGTSVVVEDTLLPANPVLLRRITIHDDSGAGGSVQLRILTGFEISESNALNGVAYEPAPRTLRFFRRRRHLLWGALHEGQSGFDEYLCGHHRLPRGGTPADALLHPGQHEGSTASVGDVEAVGGISLNLQHGRAEVWLWLCAGATAVAVHDLNALLLRSGPEKLFNAALEHQRSWLAARTQQDTSPDEFSTAEAHSLHIARAHVDSGGAIVAAVDSATLDPGRESYAYCWPRDGALIADTLSAAGDIDAAAAFFRYCATLEKTDGALLQRYHPDGSVASSWMASVEAGRTVVPVQADETALVLWALERHVGRHEDRKLAKELRDTLLLPCTEFLLRWRGPTGLPRESVDLWEERRGIHAFTAAASIAGLRAAAQLLPQCHQRRLAALAKDAADAMEAALRASWHAFDLPPRSQREISHDGASLGHADTRVDASLLGLQILGVLQPKETIAAKVREACYERLQVPTWVGGHARYEQDQYLRTPETDACVPGNPWPLAGLLLARAFAEAGEHERARSLIRGVLLRAGPCGTLAEQHHPSTAAPMGVEPLAWAHAALVDAVRALR